MRNLKKILALVLALMMVVSVMATASAAEYADADKITYTQAVEVMSELAILQGDGTNFNPNGELNRAEAAVIITKILLSANLKTLSQQADALANTFTDVSATHWGLDYIKYCANEGIIIGNGNGKFDPAGKLTGYAFAKMLLITAGVGESDDYLPSAGQTWESKVLAAAKDAGLLSGLSTLVLSKNITREQAAQMALNALVYGGVETTYYYVVEIADNDVIVGKHLDMTDAYIMAAILNSSTEKYEVIKGTETEGSLLKNNFDTTRTSGTDSYGRPATVYTYDASSIYRYTKAYTRTPVKSYTTATLPATVLADLGDYLVFDNATGGMGVWLTNELKYVTEYYLVADDTALDLDITVTNGTAKGDIADGISFAAIAGLTGYNKIVEVYTDAYGAGVITDVVVIETKTAPIANVTKANALYGTPSYVYMADGSYTVNTAGYKVGDIVSWNQSKSGTALNVAPATSFVGTLTSYNNLGTYTINGTNYVCDDDAVKTVINTKLGVPYNYYVGANNSIVYAAPVVGSVNTNYAVIQESRVDLDTTMWGTETATVQVKALLSDGTCGVYDLNVYTTVAGKAYILVGNTPVMLASYTADDALAGYLNQLYTYTAADGILTLGAPVATYVNADTAKNGDIYVDYSVGTIAIGALASTVDAGAAVINSETNTVLSAGVANKYVAVKGTGSLKTAATSAWVVYQVVENAKGEESYVVTDIIAPATQVASAAAAADLSNFALVSPVYTVSKDVTLVNTYTYVAYKVDGSVVNIVSKGVELAPSFIVYDPATMTKVDDASPAAVEAEVKAIVGTTYELGTANYKTVLDATKVVVVTPGAELEVGATVVYYDIPATPYVDVIFVTEAAE